MNKTDTELNETERTKRLVEELCARPLLRERVEAILKLVRSDEGPIAKADHIEELLVQEMRKLGHNAMQEWATRAEARSVAEFQQDSPAARCFKKKS